MEEREVKVKAEEWLSKQELIQDYKKKQERMPGNMVDWSSATPEEIMKKLMESAKERDHREKKEEKDNFVRRDVDFKENADKPNKENFDDENMHEVKRKGTVEQLRIRNQVHFEQKHGGIK